ncbi:MAG: hypothetical protein WD602_08600 [Actinomycetota bacterium]
MKRLSLVSALCSAFVLAAPAQAASAQTPNLDLGALLDGVSGLLGSSTHHSANPASPRSLEQEIENLLRVESTAYCLTGTMASGKPVYDGAAAMNGVPLGTRYQVVSGPQAGKVYTVEDRIGHSSEFDIAFPGDCDAAVAYGRRIINIEPVQSG